ncbi:MAG: hypothetical protein JO166_19625 [Deltaproteobacteria bacterium]|nr:hypothetical protein [Deltaproteobacteria bacterium]
MLIALAFLKHRRMLHFGQSNQFSVGGKSMLRIIVRVIIEQLVSRIVAMVIGALL